ncbi:hypothetical protein [Actinomycetospora aeridis]|uniref:PH (Pleckstrin Homology) domain-containing protein n=1 Tax=Actinomycetospora aeridis TaxID=3129231 RepID=A0ABU8NCI7_9PSEU
MTSHGDDTQRIDVPHAPAPGVRVWVLPRWRRFLNLALLVVVTTIFALGARSLLHGGGALSLFSIVWLVAVVVLVPLNIVLTLRTADRVELHPEGTLLLSGAARVLHTHVRRVRRLRRKRSGEGWVWTVHTDDGRIAMTPDLPRVDELLAVLRQAGAEVPERPRRRGPFG